MSPDRRIRPKEFKEIDTWIVGYEPDYCLFECQEGDDLSLEQLIPFFVDSLKGINQSIKSGNPNAKVLAHFLGRSGYPIYVREKLIQPSELIDAIYQEISKRGELLQVYFDDLASIIEPELLTDRQPIEPPPLNSKGYSDSAYWDEPFNATATHVPTDSDYSDKWDDVATQGTLVSISASGGWATIDLEDGGGNLVSGAAKSVEDYNYGYSWEDVIPDEEFGENAAETERNRWTAVADFKGSDLPVDEDWVPHLGIYIRGQDVYWTGVGANQTRFGTIIYGNDYDVGACNDEPCAALQFSCTEIDSRPPAEAGTIYHFDIDELPWDNPTNKYRVQIEEMEVKRGGVYELQWWAYIYERIDPGDDELIESYGPIWESTLTGTYNCEIPNLTSSRIGFGFTVGKDGEAQFDIIATNYWQY